MNNEIHNEMELSFALCEVKEQFKKWISELKLTHKRTYAYSKERAMWKDVQRRMVGDFKYSREAEKLFHDYFSWSYDFAKKMKMRCITTK